MTRGSRSRWGRAALALAAGAGALLAACGGPPAASLPVPSTSGASGCGRPAPEGSSTVHLSVDGRSRLAVVHVPPGYTGSGRVAVVLNLHGSGATATDQEGFSGMDATADSDGFLAVYPQGLIPEGAGFDWNVPNEPLYGGHPVPAGAVNDVTFLTQLVGALEARYCISPGHVYATGFSGGARMASQLACDASTIFAAVAPVSGLRLPVPCHPGRDVPVIAFHGSADPVDPYAGNGQAYWTYSVPEAARDWASQDGCSSTPATRSGKGYTLTTYSGCGGGAIVALYTLAGEGHEWPGGPRLPARLTAALGPQSSAVDANATMWSFFRAHPLS